MFPVTRKILLFLTVLIFAGSASTVFSQTLQELLKEGDQYTDQFENQKALQVYLKADSLFPNNWEVDWRISRAYVDIAENMPGETGDQEDAQLAKYQTAYNYADKAVKQAPDKAVTYVRRAIANGKIALFKGVFSVAGVVNSVRADCEKAISLGNGGAYVQALAHYILGRTNAKISEKWYPARAALGLGWADNKVAISEYNKAISIYPNFRMFYVDLAKSYIEEDEYSKAREMLRKAIASPKKNQNDDKYLAEAKKLMEEIKDE